MAIITELKNHVVFYSGGLGSFGAALRVIEKHGTKNLSLLFTDTLIEDQDLYRFLIETAGYIFKIDKSIISELASRAKNLIVVEENMNKRKEELERLRLDTNKAIPQFIWLSEKRDPWDIFFYEKFLGNSRIAQCSRIIKQEQAGKYIKKNFDPENTTLYLGIDWTETHRTVAPKKNWSPFEVEFPMCEEPLINKIDVVKSLEKMEIQTPRLYAMKFEHNNCGGFCVRAGQGHFANLLEQNRPLYLYHENREQDIRKLIGKDVSMIRKQKKGVKYNYTLKDLRIDIENERKEDIDFLDIGGCGCFVSDDED